LFILSLPSILPDITRPFVAMRSGKTSINRVRRMLRLCFAHNLPFISLSKIILAARPADASLPARILSGPLLRYPANPRPPSIPDRSAAANAMKNDATPDFPRRRWKAEVVSPSGFTKE
jgi:hypothetical protein